MADKTIRLEVVTPERIVFNEEVDFISVPGAEGRIGILPEHAPLITGLKIGQLTIKEGKEEIILAISGGFAETKDSKVVILAETAERPEEIDADRATLAKERAEGRLASRSPETDVLRAELALKRAMNRLKVKEMK